MKNNPKAQILADSLDIATTKLLMEDKSPQRKVGEIDSRESHFFLAKYWAEALGSQKQDLELQKYFSGILKKLTTNESKIMSELAASQGKTVDLGGYYKPDEIKRDQIMRPSSTLNSIFT